MQCPASAPAVTLTAGVAIGGVELAGLDVLGAVIVLVLFLLGMARGLWWQLIRLAGIVAAVVLARGFGNRGAEWIQRVWPEIEPRMAHGVAWIALFLVGMGVAMLLGMLGHRLLEALQLGLVNRVTGGILGAATGLVAHIALVMALCQLAPKSFVEQKVAGTYSDRLYQATGARWKGLLNPVAAAEVERLLVAPSAPASGHSLQGEQNLVEPPVQPTGEPPPEDPPQVR
jgi:uncharacterized membrane protein required for colicin V production